MHRARPGRFLPLSRRFWIDSAGSVFWSSLKRGHGIKASFFSVAVKSARSMPAFSFISISQPVRHYFEPGLQYALFLIQIVPVCMGHQFGPVFKDQPGRQFGSIGRAVGACAVLPAGAHFNRFGQNAAAGGAVGGLNALCSWPVAVSTVWSPPGARRPLPRKRPRASGSAVEPAAQAATAAHAVAQTGTQTDGHVLGQVAAQRPVEHHQHRSGAPELACQKQVGGPLPDFCGKARNADRIWIRLLFLPHIVTFFKMLNHAICIHSLK